MNKSKPKIRIERVEELPKPKRPLRKSIYDDLMKEILKQEKGIYKISIEGKTLKQIYHAISKRITERKLPLKLRVRSGELYIEKIE